jgi:hypothetical protein
MPLQAESWKTNQQLPIVYEPGYNITLFGLEKLHPFDSCKFTKVMSVLLRFNHDLRVVQRLRASSCSCCKQSSSSALCSVSCRIFSTPVLLVAFSLKLDF